MKSHSKHSPDDTTSVFLTRTSLHYPDGADEKRSAPDNERSKRATENVRQRKSISFGVSASASHEAEGLLGSGDGSWY